jgi:2-amino-4-hydroxy-6-hydroxymethyldihydropteridine diphosphokinase
LYETEPVRDRIDPREGWFLNGVVQLETNITPRSLLSTLQEIERALDRDEDNRSGPRTIDLDILFYGEHVIKEPGLTIPHPRLHQRRFVLMPMNELDPLWVHPTLNQSMAQLLTDAKNHSQVRLLFPQPSTRYGSRPASSSLPNS